MRISATTEKIISRKYVTPIIIWTLVDLAVSCSVNMRFDMN
jgi:hypothetical protein